MLKLLEMPIEFLRDREGVRFAIYLRDTSSTTLCSYTNVGTSLIGPYRPNITFSFYD